MNSPSHFSQTRRIYINDTDYSGVVYHSNYLIFMEQARSEFLLQLGWNHLALAETVGHLVVASLAIAYRAPIALGDTVTTRVTLKDLSGVKIHLEQTICAEHSKQIHSEATVTLACVNQQLKLQRLPAALRNELIAAKHRAQATNRD